MIIYLCNQEQHRTASQEKKLKKPLDKPSGMCYNINVIKERTAPKERDLVMGRIEKDKNLYKFYVDGKDKPYILDVNTGIILGLRGTAVNTIPPLVKKTLNELWYRQGFTATSVLRLMYNDYRPQNHAELYAFADKLDAIGYAASVYELSNIRPYLADIQFKDLAKWLKENAGGYVHDYLSVRMQDIWCAKMGLRADEHLTQPMIEWLYKNMNDSRYHKEDIQCFAYFLSRGAWEFFDSHGYMRDHLRDLWSWCNMMDKPMEKSDFYRQYINTKRAYEQRKNELLDAGIRKNQLARPALAFENDTFEVIIPTTNAELIAEGENQHNCVGGYGQRVAEGNRYVVFIRRKSDPTKAYITCDIYTDGTINQYLTKYNYGVSADDAEAFKRAYQEHLSTHWGE